MMHRRCPLCCQGDQLTAQQQNVQARNCRRWVSSCASCFGETPGDTRNTDRNVQAISWPASLRLRALAMSAESREKTEFCNAAIERRLERVFSADFPAEESMSLQHQLQAA